MKKLLLVTILCALVIAVNAQPRNKVVSGEKLTNVKEVRNVSPDAFNSTVMPMKDLNLVGNTNRSLSKSEIGSSYNPYTLLVPEQSSLTANQALNTVMFTHRQCSTYPDYLGGANASGWVQASFSIDGGMTFDSTMVVHDDLNGATFNAGRYPSGVIYNPEGNTNPYDAYAITAGWVLIDTYPVGQDWDGNFLASMKLDSTNGDVQKFLYEPGEVDTTALRRFMIACDEGVIHIGGTRLYGPNSTFYIPYQAIMYDGVWNEDDNMVDWEVQYLVPDFVNDYEDTPQANPNFAMAYSQDGEIAYCAWSGTEQDTPNPLGIWPVVYKSENGGEDWDLMETYDFEEIPSIYDSLVPVQTGTEKRPYFNAPADVCVDAMGQLHWFGYVHSAWSDDPDSVYYITVFAEDPNPEANNLEGLLYDVYTKPDGTWDALPIAWVHSEDGLISPSTLDWDARPQMSRTTDGEKIFYVWLDTDYDFSRYNVYPDVYSMSFDVTGNGWTKVDSVTRETQFWAENNGWMFVSDIAFDNGNGSYTVPVSTHRLSNYEDLLPTYHYLLNGVEFSDDDYPYVGIDDTPTVNNILSVSQNYPNPFDNTSIVKVELQEASELTLQVYNLMGQIVYEYSAGHVFAGAHQLTIEAGNLTEGVYFYSVKAGENIVTHKMIVD